jgi:hypothetical protein
MPIDKGTSKPITQLSGLQINYKDQNSCFNPPIVTTKERNALVNTDDPTHPIKDGTLIFNSDTGYEEYYSGDKWIEIKEGGGGTGDVTGPANATDNNIAVFDGTTGKKIKDGGPKVEPINQLKKGKNATSLYKLSNLGALQFGSNENVADTGVILVDSLTPITFQTQGTGAEARVCTVINGEEGAGSSSPSALLEINSTEGAFLPSRLTIAQRDALTDPQNGYICYNTDDKKMNFRQDNNWISIDNSPVSGGFKNLIYYTVQNPPSQRKVKVSDIIGNADCAKLTLVGSGGDGGTSSAIQAGDPNNFPGCGGGGGGTLIVYLRNLSFKEYWFYFVEYYTGGTPMGYTYVGINQTSVVTTDQTTFHVNPGENGNNGSIGNYQGGAGGGYIIGENSQYDKSNYSYIGIPGSRGNVGFRAWAGSTSSMPVGGSGGNSLLGLGGGSVLGSNGIDGSFYGGGGSGGAGNSTPGGSGGKSGLIMLEW